MVRSSVHHRRLRQLHCRGGASRMDHRPVDPFGRIPCPPPRGDPRKFRALGARPSTPRDSAHPPAFKHVMIVAYVGTPYAGWQYQPEEGRTWSKLQTVQGRLMGALTTALNLSDFKDLRMKAASRTDAGVHAHGNVVQFFSRQPIAPSGGEGDLRNPVPGTIDGGKLLLRLNKMLPKTIRVLWVAPLEGTEDFHVTRDCVLKEYNYCLSFNAICEDPFHASTRHHVPRFKLLRDLPKSADLASCVDSIEAAARLMEGEHDFAAFSNKTNDPVERLGRANVRAVERCSVVRDRLGLTVSIRGKGFLYRQCRHMVGAMLWHAQGRGTLESLSEALRDGEAYVAEGKRQWHPAPAHGLHLMWCQYERLGTGLVVPLPHDLNLSV